VNSGNTLGLSDKLHGGIALADFGFQLLGLPRHGEHLATQAAFLGAHLWLAWCKGGSIRVQLVALLLTVAHGKQCAGGCMNSGGLSVVWLCITTSSHRKFHRPHRIA